MPDLSYITVLVVDDDRHMRDLLGSLLHSCQVGEVKTAADGSEALKVMTSSPVDLVISDCQLEPMDGLRLVEAIRTGERDTGTELPIILVTAYSELHRVQKAGDLGVLHYLTKPISRGKLMARLEHLFGHQDSASRQDDTGGAPQLQSVIDNLTKEFVTKANLNIEEIFAAYRRAVEDPKRRAAMIRQIARIAHDIKGQGGSFGYPLMSEIAASLGEFCKRTPDPRPAQLEIVTVHVDAMRAVMGGDMRGDAGDDGHTLLSMLETASRKHMGGTAGAA